MERDVEELSDELTIDGDDFAEPLGVGEEGAPTNRPVEADLARAAEDALDAAEQAAEDAVEALEDVAFASRDGEVQVQAQDFSAMVEEMRARLEDTNGEVRDLRRWLEQVISDAGETGDELGAAIESPVAEAGDGAEAVIDEVPAATTPILERRRVFTRKHRRH